MSLLQQHIFRKPLACRVCGKRKGEWIHLASSIRFDPVHHYGRYTCVCGAVHQVERAVGVDMVHLADEVGDSRHFVLYRDGQEHLMPTPLDLRSEKTDEIHRKHA